MSHISGIIAFQTKKSNLQNADAFFSSWYHASTEFHPPQIHLSKQFHLQVLNISFAKGKNGSFGLSKK